MSIKIREDLIYVGGNDEKLSSFDNMYSLPKGMSFNAYLIKDDKNILISTIEKGEGDIKYYDADPQVSRDFISRIKEELNGETLDYLIAQHLEPDHSGSIEDIIKEFKDVKIVTSSMGKNFLKALSPNIPDDSILVGGPNLNIQTANHSLKFIPAPLVHWPDVLFVYDEKTGDLYSSDAFGTFGKNEHLFADEYNQDEEFFSEMRRYYTNIVGKFGTNVISALNNVSKLNISTILPLHGPIWRKDFDKIISKYTSWASYTPEDNSFMVVTGSIYGHTAKAAEALKKFIPGGKYFDASKTNISYLVSEAFKVKTIVIASITHEGEIFPPIEDFLIRLTHLGLKGRNFAIIENGLWLPTAGKKIKEYIEKIPSSTLIEPIITIKGSLKEEQNKDLDLLASKIKETF